MVQEIKQTDKEKLAMYMKLSKRKLATMLINANNVIDEFTSLRNFKYEVRANISFPGITLWKDSV